MLRDIINFCQTRTGYSDRDEILREINRAWERIWSVNDLPNSLYTCIIAPPSDTNIIALPRFVYELRKARYYKGPQIEFYRPERYFSQVGWYQHTFEWQTVGVSPLKNAVLNASTVTITIPDALDTPLIVTLIGQTDRGAKARDIITFEPGETSKVSVETFAQFFSISKNIITEIDVTITDADGREIAVIDSDKYNCRHVLMKTAEDCSFFCADSGCCCPEILFKRVPDTLYYDEDDVPEPWGQVLQADAVAHILSTKEGKEKRAGLFATQAAGLTTRFGQVSGRGQNKPIDFGPNPHITRINGWI